MARKSNKSVTSDRKFTTVPPKAKPVAEKTAVVVALPETTKPVVAAAVATPTVKPSIAPFLTALHDVDADIAREAATSLGQSADTAAVEPLIEILSNSNGYFHSVVRSAAAVSLGQLKDRRAIEALLGAVSDPISDPSTEAIRALTVLADPRAVAKLIEVVRNEDGFFANSVRRAAVLGLVKLGGETAIAELTRVAADEQEDTVIRQEAGESVTSKI